MKLLCKLILLFLFCFAEIDSSAQKKNTAIVSGVPWYDEKGNTVSAHGANIIKENGKYYLFGERHDDSSNDFVGFNCYSSTDLYNWKFERIALPQQTVGKLGPNRVGERCKVMKCPSTGEYIMYMHADTLGYVDQFVGYATATNITGPYTFHGPLLFNGKPIKKWDMGTFQDKDGSGYVLLHGGDIYKLNDDYKSISEQVNKAFERGFESPAIFHKDSLYYFLGSDLTGWERNDNYYFTATSLKGPWIKRGFFAPEGTLTWNSQTTFVLPIEGSKETTYMFMGDRWSFPKQTTAATYVWQPLSVSGYTVSLIQFWEAWKIDQQTGIAAPVIIKGKTIDAADKRIVYNGNWENDTLSLKSTDEKGASFSVTVKATQIGIYGLSRPDGGYASIIIKNSKGETVLTSNVDFYSKYARLQTKFMSPSMKKDTYTVTVKVLGEKWWWKEKSGRLSGSKGHYISINNVVVVE
ncbi:glycosyl hydrolase family 43 [Lacibacter luteus]|uniref:Glycosyl hydrolase family 43 n=1 Tax=Lacibacter luteus TaxID=2508719 RepID=A0A4Q1CLA7_9BACT|nr:family 43 glycosylhydrolase [Lacibacter luteus]RXK61787.1 glycosyl hydrolase family 43 [Lacibacter luteus]